VSEEEHCREPRKTHEPVDGKERATILYSDAHEGVDRMSAAKPRFIAATDFSEDASWAAQRAALLAAQNGAQLELLHVVAEEQLNALRTLLQAKPDGVAKLLEDVRHTLSGAAAALAKTTGASVESRVEIGEVLEVIAAQTGRADLLALGARGTSPLRDAILGTTAERLLGKCAPPMLIAKRPAERPYEHVLVALDFSPVSEGALRAALRLAPRAVVTAVHAYDVPFDGKLRLAGVSEDVIDAYRYRAAEKAIAEIRALGERTAGGPARVAHKIGPGYAAHLILENERALRADLIVLGKQRRPAMQELVLGRVARHVLADARSDVLVVPG
jgi:nucleotide-binding universal stress UspA family protein